MGKPGQTLQKSLSRLEARQLGEHWQSPTHRLANEAEANDVAQETFVKVYSNRTKFRHEAKFSTWLYTIATNLVRTHYRWKGRHPEV